MAEARVIGVSNNRSTTAAQTSVGATAALVTYAKIGRVFLRIQNTGTTTLYLNLNETAPTATVYHAALASCNAANDGTGGIFAVDGWAGAVTALSSATGGTMVITEVLGPASWA